jgi:hypothetical protein
MIITTETLLDTTTYGVPSGNYDGSSLDFLSDIVTGGDYYQGRSVGGLQTITIRVNGFVGNIKIEATLNDDPTEAFWFPVHSFGDGSSIETGTFPINIIGNFVWVRAEIIDFTAGTIESIFITF